jgi:hypothetical protein
MIETVRQDPAKLFMLGLDSASLPFIRANAGQLPFLASLVEEGTVADLGSPATHLSASVCRRSIRGRQPGVHGSTSPFQWSAEDRHVSPHQPRTLVRGVPCRAVLASPFPLRGGYNRLRRRPRAARRTGARPADHQLVLPEFGRRHRVRPAGAEGYQAPFRPPAIGAEVPVPKSRRECIAIRDRLIAAVRAKADARCT